MRSYGFPWAEYQTYKAYLHPGLQTPPPHKKAPAFIFRQQGLCSFRFEGIWPALKESVNELLRIKSLKVINAFPDSNVPDGNLQFLLNGNRYATFSRTIQLG